MSERQVKFPRVAIGLPVCGPPSWELLRTLVSLQPRGKWALIDPARPWDPFSPEDALDWVNRAAPANDDWMLVEAGKPDRPYPIEVARNRIFEGALRVGFEWVLNVDQDVVLHPDTLLRLLSWNEPVVGVLYFTRYIPPMPTIYAGKDPDDESGTGYFCQIGETRQWILEHPELLTSDPVVLYPRPDDALRPVDFTGCHCLLVHREVIEAVGDPWFERQTEIECQGTGMDRDFCEKAARAGYQVHVDRSVQAGHLCSRSIGGLDFIAFDQIADWSTEEFIPGGKYNGKNSH